MSCCSCAAASGRIAVVNLERVFREYYKSRIAEEMISKQAAAYKNYLLRLNNELRQLAEDAKNARHNALNIALSPADKQKAEQEAAAKQNLVKAKEAEIRMFVQERSNDLRKLETSKRTEILNEIRQELKKRAAAEGFEFVFDSSGKTMNDQPQLLVFPERSDITKSVIRELNRTRSLPANK